MAVTFKQLEALVWVADLGSFRGAAQQLNTTQPNISARIAGLEGLAGAPILDRGTMTLTPKGDVLLDTARQLLRDRDRFLSQANEQSLLHGRVRLGVTEMVAHTWLRDFIRAASDRFPQVSLELTSGMARELDDALGMHQLDLALINGPFTSDAVGHPLGSFPFAWVAAPDLGLAGRLDRATLLAHPILTHARGTWPYRAIVNHLAHARPRIIPSSNLSMSLQMAMDGIGIALVPVSMAADALQRGTLQVLDYDWTPDPMEFEARYDPIRAAEYVQSLAQMAQDVALAWRAANDPKNLS